MSLVSILNTKPMDYDKEKLSLLRVFTNGGSISPSQLKKILGSAKKAGVNYVHFGSRQDILFPVLKKNVKAESIGQEVGLNYELYEQERQNIVSSYVASGITSATPWVHSDTYHYILEDFNHQPKMKINLVDPAQKLVPLYTGDFNFIVSPLDNYWFLYLCCLENKEPQASPFLVYSSQIAELSLFMEEALQMNSGLTNKELIRMVAKNFDMKESREQLKVPENLFPYYEGFHKMSGNQHWLGLYWRNNQYDIPFLEAICELCAETNVGKIGITPWKSFIVKGIPDSQLLKWEKLLGKFGINTRHSSLELYWHTPVIDKEAMDLKRFLVRTFDQNDINTSGLSFTIQTRPMVTFSSIIIEKNSPSKFEEDFDLFESYNIYHTKKFNPNQQEKIVYARNVLREDLPGVLIQLSQHYYDQLQLEPAKAPEKKEQTDDQTILVHQCSACFTVYDSRYGDGESEIPAGTPFHQLPKNYCCSLCGEGKEGFREKVVPQNSYQFV